MDRYRVKVTYTDGTSETFTYVENYYVREGLLILSTGRYTSKSLVLANIRHYETERM